MKIEKRKIIAKEMKFECEFCNTLFTKNVDVLEFNSVTKECELCGSHGSISVRVSCPKCDREHKIYLYEW